MNNGATGRNGGRTKQNIKEKKGQNFILVAYHV